MSFIDRLKRIKFAESFAFYLVIEFILFFGMFARYNGHSEEWFSWFYRLTILFLFCYPGFWKVLQKHYWVVISFIVTIILFYLSADYGKEWKNVRYNLDTCLKSIMILAVLFLLVQINGKEFWITIKRNFLLINGFFVFNLVALAVQISGTPFLIKEEWLLANSFYPDLCSGLFGKNGTHILGFFAVFVLLFNLQYAREIEIRRHSLLIYCYCGITMILMLFFSTYNDNFTLFFLYGLAILSFILIVFHGNKKKMLLYICSSIGVAIVLIIILSILPQTREWMNRMFIGRFLRFMRSERLSLVVFALKNKSTYFLGKGMGIESIITGEKFGFKHFGMNSASSFLLLGGLWYYISYSSLLSVFLYYFKSSTERKTIRFMIIMGLVVLLSFYTTFFSNVYAILWTSMIVLVLTRANEQKTNLLKNKM